MKRFRPARLSAGPLVPLLASLLCSCDVQEPVVPDAPVEGRLEGVSGLAYATGEDAGGVTDTGGRFVYREGDRITFSLAGHDIATVPGERRLQIGDLGVGPNAMRLLLAMDTDAWPANGLSLPPEAASARPMTRVRRPLDRLSADEVDRLIAELGSGGTLLGGSEQGIAAGTLQLYDQWNTRLAKHLRGDIPPLKMKADFRRDAVPGVGAESTQDQRIDAYVFDELFGIEMQSAGLARSFQDIEAIREGFYERMDEQIAKVTEAVNAFTDGYAAGSGEGQINADALIGPVTTRLMQTRYMNEDNALQGLSRLDRFNAAGEVVGRTVLLCAIRARDAGVDVSSQAAARRLVKGCATDVIKMSVKSAAMTIAANPTFWPAARLLEDSGADEVLSSMAQVLLACYGPKNAADYVGCAKSAGVELYKDIGAVVNEVNATLQAGRVVDRMLERQAGYYLAELHAKTGNVCSPAAMERLGLADERPCYYYGSTREAKAAFCALADAVGDSCGLIDWRTNGRVLRRIGSTYLQYRTAFKAARSDLVNSELYALTQCQVSVAACLPTRAEIVSAGYESTASGWTLDAGVRVRNGSGFDLAVQPTRVRLVSFDGELLHESGVAASAGEPLPGRGSRDIELSFTVPDPGRDALLQIEFRTWGAGETTVVATTAFRTPIDPGAYDVALDLVSQVERDDGTVDVRVRASTPSSGASAVSEGVGYRFEAFGPHDRIYASGATAMITGARDDTEIRVVLQDAGGRPIDSAWYDVGDGMSQDAGTPVPALVASGANIVLRGEETQAVTLEVRGGRPPYSARFLGEGRGRLDVAAIGGLRFAFAAVGPEPDTVRVDFEVEDAAGSVAPATVSVAIRRSATGSPISAAPAFEVSLELVPGEDGGAVAIWPADPAATRYELTRLRYGEDRETTIYTGTRTSHSDVDVPRGEPYYFAVRACNEIGCSAPRGGWITLGGFIDAAAPRSSARHRLP